METHEPTNKASKNISILLPTRGRTETLRSSLTSLLDRALYPDKLEILLAFDDDDVDSIAYFEQTIVPTIKQYRTSYTSFGFARLGYLRLNEYLNYLCRHSKGSWLMFWGDDAIMQTQSWDQKIMDVEDFRVLRMPTHNQHPYAVFPIVRREWFEVLGYLSPHQLTDSWISQVGYLMDLIYNIDVDVVHDRFDITGNNNDETYKNRPMLEGNRQDPRDFNNERWIQKRFQDCDQLADFLSRQDQDITWWQNVKEGKQDPWVKMCSPEYDPNGQVSRFQRT